MTFTVYFANDSRLEQRGDVPERFTQGESGHIETPAATEQAVNAVPNYEAPSVITPGHISRAADGIDLQDTLPEDSKYPVPRTPTMRQSDRLFSQRVTKAIEAGRKLNQDKQ